MYLNPSGDVTACCQNNLYRLGSIREQTLLDIWFGDRADRLRAELGASSFALGCEGCGDAVRRGHRESAYLTVFDRFPLRSKTHAMPANLELALSNACNLQCEMCNGELSSAIRIHRERRSPLPSVYNDSFFEEICSFLVQAESLVLLGGEPFLSRETLRIIHLLGQTGSTARCHVTTNGTQWNDTVRTFVSSQPCHIAVSLDGVSATTNESIRRGTEHQRVLDNLVAMRDATRAHGSDTSISFTLQRTNAAEFTRLLLLADELDVDVSVNRLMNPLSHSILHLPHAEQVAFVESLDDSIDEAAPRLGRNRAVFELERSFLRAHVDRQAAPSPATAVVTWPTSPSVAIVIGANQVVESVTLAHDAPTAPWDGLVGHNPIEIITRMQQAFGELVDTQLDFDGSVEVRTMQFEDTTERSHVQASARVDSDGAHRWELRIVHDSSGVPMR